VIHFYDAASPQNVPSGVHAAVYVNGYAWPQSEIDRMSRVFRISVLREASWGRVARCLDIENGAALPQDMPAFIAYRKHRWPNTTAYVNRSNWQTVWELVRQSGEPEPRWWVATLDGTQDVELTINGKVVARPWAVQYGQGPGGGYDLSVLHGIDDFVKP
jgi:hypothetical protein